MEGPEEHHSMVYQVNQSVATGGHGQPGPRAVYIGARGTKRPESYRQPPPNAKHHKSNKGGGGQWSS